jgi:hypothetical protein
MHIERLRLVVEEAEAVDWCAGLLRENADIEEPRLAFEPGSLVFEGTVRIPLAGLVPFRTEWAAAVDAGGFVIIRLNRASAFGWSGGSGFLTGLIMDRIKSRLEHRPGLHVEADRLRVDPAVLLAGLPVTVKLRVAAVTVEKGRVVLEAD